MLQRSLTLAVDLQVQPLTLWMFLPLLVILDFWSPCTSWFQRICRDRSWIENNVSFVFREIKHFLWKLFFYHQWNDWSFMLNLPHQEKLNEEERRGVCEVEFRRTCFKPHGEVAVPWYTEQLQRPKSHKQSKGWVSLVLQISKAHVNLGLHD